jgi:hypothetical protein
MKYDAITAAGIELLADQPINARTTRAKALADAIEAKHPGAIGRARRRVLDARLEARFKGNPPDWAKRLIVKHFPGFSQLVWRRSKVKAFTSGRCTPERIVITQSPRTSEDDQRVTLLHEIAHRVGFGYHDERYYREFYRLLVAEHLYRHALGMPYGWGGALRRAARVARAAS